MKLSDRLRKTIEQVTPATRRFITLEERTKIKSETWRTWWNRGGKASEDMIQGVAQSWPEYAFWIATGITDFSHGHIKPGETVGRHSHFWEKRIYENDSKHKEIKQRVRSAAKDYFLKKIEREYWVEEIQNDIADRNEIDIQQKELEIEEEVISLSRIREDQEETLNKIELAALNAGEKEQLAFMEWQSKQKVNDPDASTEI